MATDIKAKADIKPEIRDLAARIKDNIAIEGNTASVDKDLFVRLLPEGVTEDMVKRYQEHTTQVIAATSLALGQAAIPAMKKHKDLDNLTLNMPLVGKDNLQVNFKRQDEVGAPGAAEKTTKFGVVSAKMQIYGTKTRGEFAKVREELSQDATDAYGS